MGVRIVGFIWNYVNWVVDGVLEKCGVGLIERGRELVCFCNWIGMLLDVLYFMEKGFWELVELSECLFIVLYFNSYMVCLNVCNLKDD